MRYGLERRDSLNLRQKAATVAAPLSPGKNHVKQRLGDGNRAP